MAYIEDATIDLTGMADQEVRIERVDEGDRVVVTEWVREVAVSCTTGRCGGWTRRTEEALLFLGQPCRTHKNHTYQLDDRTYARNRYSLKRCSCGCEKVEGEGSVEQRYSLGIYAGVYCDRGWKKSGYRDEPAWAFDPADAGERYDDDY
jgi:hypothetical protein